MVRTKISQSSALRQKRGHTAVNPRPDSTETEAPVGLNNNGPHLQTVKNGLVHTYGSTGEPENIFDKMEELKISSTESREEEEESFSTDSLSEVSKFESQFTVSVIKTQSSLQLLHYKLSLNMIIQRLYFIVSVCCPVPSPDLSFQPDEHLEVYVSASENPNHFWIQILGVRSLQLDKLTEEMNRFYNSGSPTVRTCPTVFFLTECYFLTRNPVCNCPCSLLYRSRGQRPSWWGTLWLLRTETTVHGTGPGCWEFWALDQWTFTMLTLGTMGNCPETASAV